MKLVIDSGVLYVNNHNFCFVEKGSGNGRASLEPGTRAVRTQFSHTHDRVLPVADGHGWLGADAGCDIVLGRVRGRNGLIPSRSALDGLLAKIEAAEDNGSKVVLEVR